MHKKIMFVSLIMILAFVSLTGCNKDVVSASTSSATPEAVASCSVNPVSDTPAIYGLWIKENGDQRDVLTISENNVYLVEYAGSDGSDAVRETWYQVASTDWTAGIITMKMTWVRVNGAYGGFDSPSKEMKFVLDEDKLFLEIFDESMEAPAETSNGPWIKQ